MFKSLLCCKDLPQVTDDSQVDLSSEYSLPKGEIINKIASVAISSNVLGSDPKEQRVKSESNIGESKVELAHEGIKCESWKDSGSLPEEFAYCIRSPVKRGKKKGFGSTRDTSPINVNKIKPAGSRNDINDGTGCAELNFDKEKNKKKIKLKSLQKLLGKGKFQKKLSCNTLDIPEEFRQSKSKKRRKKRANSNFTTIKEVLGKIESGQLKGLFNVLGVTSKKFDSIIVKKQKQTQSREERDIFKR